MIIKSQLFVSIFQHNLYFVSLFRDALCWPLFKLSKAFVSYFEKAQILLRIPNCYSFYVSGSWGGPTVAIEEAAVVATTAEAA